MKSQPKIGEKFTFQQGSGPIEIVKIIEIFGNPEKPLDNPLQTIRITSKNYKDWTMYLSALIKVNERLTA